MNIGWARIIIYYGCKVETAHYLIITENEIVSERV